MKFIKKMKKFTKRNKTLTILLLMTIIFIILAGIFVYKVIFSNQIHTGRIDNNHVNISEEEKQLWTTVLTKESVSNINFSVMNRLVKVFVEYNIETDATVAIKNIDDIISQISPEVKAYYDFSFVLTILEDTEEDKYPIFGSLHKSKDVITWTNR